MPVVYFSSAQSEENIAEMFVSELYRTGMKVTSRAALGGSREGVEAAIRTCDALVYLHSPAAEQSAEVQADVNFARSLGKPIIEVTFRQVQEETPGISGASGQPSRQQPDRSPEDVVRAVRDLLATDGTPAGEERARGITLPSPSLDEQAAQVTGEAEEAPPAFAQPAQAQPPAPAPGAPPTLAEPRAAERATGSPPARVPPMHSSDASTVRVGKQYTLADWLRGALSVRGSAAGSADAAAPKAEMARKEPASETLQFSAYHANALAVEEWNTLLVYAAAGDALAAVTADAATFTELGSAPRTTTGQSTRAVAHGAELTVEPHLEGVSFSPPSDTFVWRGDWHRSLFRFRATAELAGTERTGWVDIYAGPMVPIARIDLAFTFTAPRTALGTHRPAGRTVTSNPHDTVFISYSHRDHEAFRQACEEYARFGITVHTDEQLPAGADYERDLAHMIAGARVFHLLWSPTTATSAECRKEWLAALQREPTERFIKPWYWRQPLPSPPPELAQHHISFRYQRLRRKLWKPETWV